jgi:hypothetical protein
MDTVLPSFFVLYIPTRSSQSDPFSGYVRVSASHDSTAHAYTITPAPFPATFHLHSSDLPFPPSLSQSFNVNFHTSDGIVQKTVYVWSPEIRIFDTTTHSEVRVLSVAKHTDLIGRAKRNITVIKAPVVRPPATQSAPRLPPYVAKQLLELAQLKRDLCPITVEEFAANNTAVMPCGHLFTKLAIEESFRIADGRCPACRAAGAPTYV